MDRRRGAVGQSAAIAAPAGSAERVAGCGRARSAERRVEDPHPARVPCRSVDQLGQGTHGQHGAGQHDTDDRRIGARSPDRIAVAYDIYDIGGQYENARAA